MDCKSVKMIRYKELLDAERTCKSCEFFIPHITVIDSGIEIWGYGCELGGSFLNPFMFFNCCNEFKLRIKSLAKK